jgi:hypothetical protein
MYIELVVSANIAVSAVVDPTLRRERITTVAETRPIARNGTWCFVSI